MKYKNFIFSIFFIFLSGSQVRASISGPSIVYTLEDLDVGDAYLESVPDEKYLCPHIYTDPDPGSPAGVLENVLNHLREFKPKLYENTKLMKPIPQSFPIKSVVIITTVKTPEDFKTLMSEVVFSCQFTGFESRGNVSVAFHFKDSKLEKKYGGKHWAKKDVTFPAFLLKRPLAK